MLDGARGRTAWEQLIDLALDEDLTGGDVTTLATIPAEATAKGVLLVKQDGVISGMRVAADIFARVDPRIGVIPTACDGDRVTAGTVIARLEGTARGVLSGERVALNLLQRLAGVATITAAFVDAVSGTKATIIDTRKTTPGLRALEKAAVRDGGGLNHRFGLGDGVLIKDNHLAAVGGPDRITKAVRAARAYAPHTLKIEVEVTTLPEVEEAVAAGADIILLDNMSPAEMAEAVKLVNRRALLEASGRERLETVRAIAESGVDLISIGALTHSAPSLDISLDFDVV